MDGNKRVRKSVSIQKKYLDLIGDDQNFSRIVNMLLDENIERISDEDVTNITYDREKSQKEEMLNIIKQREDKLKEGIREIIEELFVGITDQLMIVTDMIVNNDIENLKKWTTQNTTPQSNHEEMDP